MVVLAARQHHMWLVVLAARQHHIWSANMKRLMKENAMRDSGAATASAKAGTSTVFAGKGETLRRLVVH
jgi:hypothetical protein